MTSRTTAYDRPTKFVDEEVAGPFAVWRHAHHFQQQPDETALMCDVIDFAAPYGLLGMLADVLVVDRYMTRLITARNEHIAAICLARHPS